MKILHVIPSVAAVRGGPSVAILGMTRSLREAGVDARVVCTDDDGPGRLTVETGQWVEWQGIPTFFLRRWSPRLKALKALREYAMAPGLGAFLRTEAWDLLHVHALFSYVPSTAMRWARRSGVPYVLRPLGLLETWSLKQSQVRKRLHMLLLDGANIRSASALHFTSLRERTQCAVGFRGEPWVVPLGVDVKAAIEKARRQAASEFGFSEGPVVLFLGRWHRKKGLDVLLGSWGRLSPGRATLMLAGGGDPAFEKQIAQEVRRLRAAGHFVVTPGFVEGMRKELLLQAADLFVLPSASENFGLSVAEALAAGTPALVSPEVALAEEITTAEAGWSCLAEPGALAHLLQCVLSQPEELRRRGANARRLAAERFSWKVCAARLREGYEGLLPARLDLSRRSKGGIVER